MMLFPSETILLRWQCFQSELIYWKYSQLHVSYEFLDVLVQNESYSDDFWIWIKEKVTRKSGELGSCGTTEIAFLVKNTLMECVEWICVTRNYELISSHIQHFHHILKIIWAAWKLVLSSSLTQNSIVQRCSKFHVSVSVSHVNNNMNIEKNTVTNK